MNYFNYFTEIEDTFVRRRGKHVYLSPLDWALIEGWKERGVPLHVALRGIERAFDSFNAKPRRRSVKSLMYCQEEVEAQHAEWLESQLGAGTNGEPTDGSAGDPDERLPFPRAVISKHLASARAALAGICDGPNRADDDGLYDAAARVASRLSDLAEDFARAAHPDAEKLEDSLTSLEKLLDEALLSRLPPGEVAAARADTEAQLKTYRGRMERAAYEQTFDNLLLKRLRERHGLPRLSLFYL